MSSPVVDASPLIFLSKGDHVDLLRIVGDSGVVPATVVNESRRGPEDATGRMLRDTEWLRTVTAPEVPPVIQAWDLGPGESAVLALAYKEPEREVIIDDLAGRRCAASPDISVHGTLGVVLLAKQQGRIERPVQLLKSCGRKECTSPMRSLIRPWPW